MADETAKTTTTTKIIRDASGTPVMKETDLPLDESPWHQDVAALKQVLEDHEKTHTRAAAANLNVNSFSKGWTKEIQQGLGIPAEFLYGSKPGGGPNANGDVFPQGQTASGRFKTHPNVANVLKQQLSEDRAVRDHLTQMLYGSAYGLTTSGMFDAIKTQIGSWRKDVGLVGTPGVKPLKGLYGSKVRNTKKRRKRKKKRKYLQGRKTPRNVFADISMGAGQGTWNVVEVHDEFITHIGSLKVAHGNRHLYRSIMCQPAGPREAFHLAGYTPACGSCAYGLQCLRQKHPNICAHCRTAVPRHFLTHLGVGVDVRIEKEYVRLQSENERVSPACPLFDQSNTLCERCATPRAQVTRIRIPDRQNLTTARYKNVRLRYAPKPAETFARHVAKKQAKGRGDLHDRQRTRHQKFGGHQKHRKHPHDMATKKMAQQKSRGP